MGGGTRRGTPLSESPGPNIWPAALEIQTPARLAPCVFAVRADRSFLYGYCIDAPALPVPPTPLSLFEHGHPGVSGSCLVASPPTCDFWKAWQGVGCFSVASTPEAIPNIPRPFASRRRIRVLTPTRRALAQLVLKRDDQRESGQS